jgi:hypothetical protein
MIEQDSSLSPIPSGILSHIVTFIPTPASACVLKYATHLCTTSASASQALIARLCTFLSKVLLRFLMCTNGLLGTVHSVRFVGREATPDVGMPREEAACKVKWVNRLRSSTWWDRKWMLATGMSCVRGWRKGSCTLRPCTSVMAYSSSSKAPFPWVELLFDG